MTLLLFSLSLSLYCIGLKMATEQGMILNFVTKLKWYGKAWAKPIISCVYCMSSVHGIIWGVAFGLEAKQIIFAIPITTAITGYLAERILKW